MAGPGSRSREADRVALSRFEAIGLAHHDVPGGTGVEHDVRALHRISLLSSGLAFIWSPSEATRMSVRLNPPYCREKAAQ